MSVGGKVIQVYHDYDKRQTWVNTTDHGDICSVLVDSIVDISLGDEVWWQGGKVFWSTKSTTMTFRKMPSLKKIGGSGVPHPLGKEFEITYDCSGIVAQLKSKLRAAEAECAQRGAIIKNCIAEIEWYSNALTSRKKRAEELIERVREKGLDSNAELGTKRT